MIDGANPNITDSIARFDRQQFWAQDFDLASAARSNELVRVPAVTQIVVDPRAFDSATGVSSTLSVGTMFVRLGSQATSAMRLEPGIKFTIPPTTDFYFSSEVQADRMARVYFLPRAFSLAFYLRFDPAFQADLTVDQITINDTAGQLITPALPGRKSVMIQNANAIGGDYVEVSSDSTFTYGNGMSLAPGQAIWWSASTSAIYGRCNTGDTADVRYSVEA